MLKTNKVVGRVFDDSRISEHFCYVCVKLNGAKKKFEANWSLVRQQILEEQSEEGDDTESEEDSEEDEIESEGINVGQKEKKLNHEFFSQVKVPAFKQLAHIDQLLQSIEKDGPERDLKLETIYETMTRLKQDLVKQLIR